MYSKRSGLLIGFHGCDLAVRDDLVNHRISFKSSTNPWDWLGWGAYFWENNEDRALDFVVELQKKTAFKNKIKQPAVLGAVIELGNCLDLTDNRYLPLIKESYRMLVEVFNKKNEPLPENILSKNGFDMLSRNLDCLVLENVHDVIRKNSLPPFDSVRSTFVEGAPIYETAGFHEKNHIQICVRNPNCIKAVFIPGKQTKWNDDDSLVQEKYKHIVYD